MTDNQLMDLYRKVCIYGLDDLRKLAPIGDIGYLNGISFYRGRSSVVSCAPPCLTGCTKLTASSSSVWGGRSSTTSLDVV